MSPSVRLLAILVAGSLAQGVATSQVPAGPLKPFGPLQPFELENLGLALRSPTAHGARHVAFLVNEANQFQDLNLDFDFDDAVVHVHDPINGTTVNLGHAASSSSDSLVVAGAQLYFVVPESAQGGLDLNGDADVFDTILFRHVLYTGSTTNLSLATAELVTDGAVVAFAVDEVDQGVDLNGDADTADDVLYVIPSAGAAPVNTGLTTLSGRIGVEGGLLYFPRSEFGDSTDFNGDGDSSDLVAHSYDPVSTTATNLGYAIIGKPRQLGRFVFMNLDEAAHFGLDANFDGDAADLVVLLHDPATLGTGPLALSVIEAYGRGGKLAFTVSEFSQGGMDLNGDGDATDFALVLFDADLSQVTVPGLAATRLALSGDVLAFSVPEDRQGATDLNGDLDASDHVAHVLDMSTHVVHNAALAVEPFLRPLNTGELVIWHALESAQGTGLDQNGDGDGLDTVPVLFDPVSLSSTSTNLALTAFGKSMSIERGRLLLHVGESEQGSTDLNGDGDATDGVLSMFDLRLGHQLEFAIAGSSLTSFGGRVLIGVSESEEGGVDLNGNGFPSDSVAHTVRLPR